MSPFNWLPNIHPLLVHFPIALFCVAVGFHLWKVIFAKDDKYDLLVLIGYILTSISLAVTYLSGRSAADHVLIPDDALVAVSTHADRAWVLLVYGLILTGLIIVVHVQKWDRSKLVDGGLAFLGVVGLGILMVTADAGGRLVYGFGVGVQENRESPKEEQVEQINHKKAVLNIQNDGSWRWEPTNEHSQPLKGLADWHLGNNTDVLGNLVADKSGKAVLQLELDNKEILFSIGSALDHVKVDIEINFTSFNGEFRLIHHLQDADTYDYLAVEKGYISMGRSSKGEKRTFESESVESKITSLSVVGDGRHLRGYVNGQLLVHAHEPPLPAGTTGLYMKGSGKILVNSLTCKNLYRGE